MKGREKVTKPASVKDAALQRIGCPYVMGGTGKVCSPSYREARAAQYPDYAAKIRKNCPRLSGSATTCANCRWCDPETGIGKLCYDCAQLALACMAAAGIPLVSGVNSQWQKTVFSEKGEISDLPAGKVCLVFRNDGITKIKMRHVGVYLGDDTVVHAKGHDYGVVRQALSAANFTHYGVPAGLYDNIRPTLRRGNSGEYVLQLQQALDKTGAALNPDGKFGTATENAVKAFQQAHGLTVDGICGPATWAALAPYLPAPEAPETPDAPADEPVQTVAVARDDVERMISRIDVMRQQLDELAYVARGWIE